MIESKVLVATRDDHLLKMEGTSKNIYSVTVDEYFIFIQAKDQIMYNT